MHSFGVNALIFIVVAWFRLYQLLEFFMIGLLIGTSLGALLWGFGNHFKGIW